jgi:hypothetical protein
VIEKIGGASRDRTDDLIVANDALSQLSYSPTRWWVLSIILAAVHSFRLRNDSLTEESLADFGWRGQHYIWLWTMADSVR